MTEWYLWEKNPGVIGVLPVSKLNDHAEKLVMRVEGSLEDAIKQAELCEKEGYSIIGEENVSGQPVFEEETVISEKPAGSEDAGMADNAGESDLPDFMALEDFLEEPAHTPETKKKCEKKRVPAADSWELEGQLSFGFLNLDA